MAVQPIASCVICCLPRSGSWMLAHGLRSTGLAGRPEEYFWDQLRPFYARQWGLRPEVAEGRFVAGALRAGTTANGMFGAKVHWFQMLQLLARLQGLAFADGLSTRQLLERFLPAPRYVRLIRQDKVRQAISYYRALKTGVWWKGRPAERALPHNGHTDFKEIERLESLLTRQERDWTRFFASQSIRPLTITYEELTGDYPGAIRKVLNFLDIDPPENFQIEAPLLEKQGGLLTEFMVHDYITIQRTTKGSPLQSYSSGGSPGLIVSSSNHRPRGSADRS